MAMSATLPEEAPRAPSSPAIDLSFVLPVHNEEGNLEELTRDLLAVGRELGRPFEVLYVDDGSSDRSPALIERLAREEPEVRGLLLRRNFGQSAALTAGFEHVRGQVVVTLDADRQNDPRDIPLLLARLEEGEGADLVCGWRKERQDPLLHRKIPSQAANALIGSLTGVRLHDYGCSLKAFRAELVHGLILYGELHRFIPVLVERQGARIVELPVRHHPRRAGRSHYGLSRLPKVLLDLLLMVFFQRFATRPLQLFGRTGGISFLIGLGLCLFLTFEKLALGQDIGGRPALLLGVLLLLTGILLIGLGLVAELVVRVYYETGERRIYAVREEFGQESAAAPPAGP